jgi:hypothetical protein
MQVNPLYQHQHVVVTIHVPGSIIPDVSTKWTCIAFWFLLLVGIVAVLVAYLITGSFDDWMKYFMAGNAICMGLVIIVCMIDCMRLSCRKRQSSVSS